MACHDGMPPSPWQGKPSHIFSIVPKTISGIHLCLDLELQCINAQMKRMTASVLIHDPVTS